MTKLDDLGRMSRAALRRIAEWLALQGRMADGPGGWLKPDLLSFLGGKLSRDQVDELTACYDSTEPFFSDDELASALGLPQKSAVLDNASKQELREAIQRLENEGRVAISWRNLGAEELRAYLTAKCTKEEAASLLWGLRVGPSKTSLSRVGSKARGIPFNASPTPASRPTSPRRKQSSGSADSRERLFGKYEVVQRLSPGGMGEVFKVRDVETSETRFLKRVRVDAQDAKALKREAQIYSKLSFQQELVHMLRVHAVERDGEHMALVLDFADGGTLGSHVERNVKLAARETKAIGLQIAAGIIELHALDVVHRDLKPANVLRHSRTWKIADFGIARNRRVQGTTTFQGAGTTGYAAPEQVEGSEADAKADIFSLGKILTFMVTGHTDVDRIDSPAIRRLVYRCTDRQPEERPTAAEALRELERLVL